MARMVRSRAERGEIGGGGRERGRERGGERVRERQRGERESEGEREGTRLECDCTQKTGLVELNNK